MDTMKRARRDRAPGASHPRRRINRNSGTTPHRIHVTDDVWSTVELISDRLNWTAGRTVSRLLAALVGQPGFDPLRFADGVRHEGERPQDAETPRHGHDSL